MKNNQAIIKTAKLAIFWVAVLASIVLIFGNTGWYHLFNDDAYEMGWRLSCMANQMLIHTALVEYQKEYNALPDDLTVLAEKEYIDEKMLFCPNVSKLKDPENKKEYAYLYYPENFGDKEKILISENIHNHFGPPLRLKNRQPIVNQIMGDGTRNEKILDPEIFK